MFLLRCAPAVRPLRGPAPLAASPCTARSVLGATTLPPVPQCAVSAQSAALVRSLRLSSSIAPGPAAAPHTRCAPALVVLSSRAPVWTPMRPMSLVLRRTLTSAAAAPVSAATPPSPAVPESVVPKLGADGGEPGLDAFAPTSRERAVGIWLAICCGLVFGMVVLGGFTRLTESGLSITEWKPFRGAAPPMNEAEWLEEFEKYQQSPEYIKIHSHMTLTDYKFIFMMEWSHRQLGRFLGLVYGAPLAFFYLKGYLTPALTRRLSFIMLLGAGQGALGWWMVKSGLEVDKTNTDVPRVSQYRLAAHLGSAFVLYVYLLNTTLSLLKPTRSAAVIPKSSPFSRLAVLTTALTFTTALSGALVAGLDAGLIYNDEFPLMGGKLLPDEAFDLQPWYRNFTENSSMVQFDHRWLGMTTFALCWATFFSGKGKVAGSPRKALFSVAHVASLQVLLGIATLLTFVPTPLAASHQANSLLLLTSCVWLLHEIRPSKLARRRLASTTAGAAKQV